MRHPLDRRVAGPAAPDGPAASPRRASTSACGATRTGRPAHHLLDPSTGRPAWTGLVGATALAPTALEAETLAKIALLSGPARGLRVLARHGGCGARRRRGRGRRLPASARGREGATRGAGTRGGMTSVTLAGHEWWLASRAAGVVALVLVSLSVGLGLANAARLVPPRLRRAVIALHEQIALAGLAVDRRPRTAAAPRPLAPPRPRRDRASLRHRIPPRGDRARHRRRLPRGASWASRSTRGGGSGRACGAGCTWRPSPRTR